MHSTEANVSHKYEQKAFQVNLNLRHIAIPTLHPPSHATFSISLSPVSHKYEQKAQSPMRIILSSTLERHSQNH